MSEIIPKGTHVKIGYTDTLSMRAVDLIFEISQDTKWGQYNHGVVIENPNGWHSRKVNHRLIKGVDTIVKPAYENNRAAKSRLDIL